MVPVRGGWNRSNRIRALVDTHYTAVDVRADTYTIALRTLPNKDPNANVVESPSGAMQVNSLLFLCAQQALENESLLDAVAMNDVSNVESCEMYISNLFQLIAGLILFYLFMYVRKNAVALTVDHVESFTIPRVNESVDVGLELRHDSWRERIDLFGYLVSSPHRCQSKKRRLP